VSAVSWALFLVRGSTKSIKCPIIQLKLTDDWNQAISTSQKLIRAQSISLIQTRCQYWYNCACPSDIKRGTSRSPKPWFSNGTKANKLKGSASSFSADEQEMIMNAYEEFQTIIMENLTPPPLWGRDEKHRPLRQICNLWNWTIQNKLNLTELNWRHIRQVKCVMLRSHQYSQHACLLSRLFVVYLFNSFALESGLSPSLISVETVTHMEEITTIFALYSWISNALMVHNNIINIYLFMTSAVGSHNSGTTSDELDANKESIHLCIDFA